MSLYLGNNLIAPNQSNSANKSLSNLDATGQAVIDGKADVDLTNVNNSGTSRSAGWAMPSGTSINLTLGASGTTYTAPANGYVYLRMIGRVNNNCGFSIFSSSNIGINEEVFQSGAHTGGFIPVKIGDTFTVGHWNSNVEAFIFIYAQGSESEAN